MSLELIRIVLPLAFLLICLLTCEIAVEIRRERAKREKQRPSR
jgi:hypothetical protein